MIASHSHLFRGARLRSEDLPSDIPPDGHLEVTVKFSDGSSAEATYSAAPTGPLLAVNAYETSAGTVLENKAWLLDYAEEDQLKVLGQAPTS